MCRKKKEVLMSVVVCVQKEVLMLVVCVQKEVLMLVVCVQKEKGSVDVGGGLYAERKKKC